MENGDGTQYDLRAILSRTNRLLGLLLGLACVNVCSFGLLFYRQVAASSNPVESSANSTIDSNKTIGHELEKIVGQDSERAIGRDLELDNLPIQGNATAPIVIVEFADYECPFCAQHAASVLRTLRTQYIDTGEIKYAFADFPLPNHSSARLLASAAICAGEQGKYWDMHEQLFEKVVRSREAVLKILEGLGLNSDKFKSCLGDDTSARTIALNEQRARGIGINATPSFAIGTVNAKGSLTIRKLLIGAQSIEVFRKAISEVRHDHSDKVGD